MARKDFVVPVSTRALTQRLDRRLRRRGLKLRKLRGKFRHADAYFTVDVERGCVVDRYVSLDVIAHEFGALETWEYWEGAGVPRRAKGK